MRDYGEDDGFIIDNTLWWEYYNNLINEMLDKIDKKIFTEEDMSRFYGDFGFGPKSYGKSFIANGREKIEPLFLFLSDIDIPAEQKIREVVEDPESSHFARGVGINFVTLFLTSLFPKKYAQWNVQVDGALD